MGQDAQEWPEVAETPPADLKVPYDFWADTGPATLERRSPAIARPVAPGRPRPATSDWDWDWAVLSGRPTPPEVRRG